MFLFSVINFYPFPRRLYKEVSSMFLRSLPVLFHELWLGTILLLFVLMLLYVEKLCCLIGIGIETDLGETLSPRDLLFQF